MAWTDWITQTRTPGDHRRGMVIGAAIAVCAALLLLWRQQTIWHAAGTLRAVVVAAREIPARTVLTADLLTTREVPQAYLPDAPLEQMAAAVGQLTLVPLAPRDVLRRAQLSVPERAGQLAAVVPPGRRAVAIPLDPQRGVGGWLQPGDVVDLYANFDFGAQEAVQGTTVLLLQRVAILSVGRDLAPAATAGPAVPRSDNAVITVAVTPAEAQRILFTLDNGTLTCALHPVTDNAEPPVQLAPATAAQVTGLTSLVKRREYRGR